LNRETPEPPEVEYRLAGIETLSLEARRALGVNAPFRRLPGPPAPGLADVPGPRGGTAGQHCCCQTGLPRYISRLELTKRERKLNTELTRKALEKVGNPNILVNLVSRRVRQLNSGGGGLSRPLVEHGETMGAGDIALAEIVDDKVTFEALPEIATPEAPVKRRRRSS
jgi:DNA-directed RNA polymerase subunit omega